MTEVHQLAPDMSGCTFSEAFAEIRDGEGYMRLPHWQDDVEIRAMAGKPSEMSHPYLYVASRFGSVPWQMTVVELFATNWEVYGD